VLVKERGDRGDRRGGGIEGASYAKI